MAKPERYSSFEEMENAPQKKHSCKSPSKKKKLTTIEEFAALLQENSIPAPKEKRSSKT
jgi:hypothetical protein